MRITETFKIRYEAKLCQKVWEEYGTMFYNIALLKSYLLDTGLLQQILKVRKFSSLVYFEIITVSLKQQVHP